MAEDDQDISPEESMRKEINVELDKLDADSLHQILVFITEFTH